MRAAIACYLFITPTMCVHNASPSPRPKPHPIPSTNPNSNRTSTGPGTSWYIYTISTGPGTSWYIYILHLQALVRLAIAKKLKASGQPKKGDISEALERLLLDDVAAKVPSFYYDP
jgi:hypothetical protein